MGWELVVGLEAISRPDERGMRTVMCILSRHAAGVVRDRSIANCSGAEKADRSNPGHIASAICRRSRHGQVCVGERVSAGQTITPPSRREMEA